jgi:hypothetical protein
MKTGWIVLGIFLASLLLIKSCHAQTIDVERLATAIGKAENSKAHPYGIMQRYRNTTPRQACINTIKHRLKTFNGHGDFITYLGSIYAPANATNDPKGLNKNWVNNVKYFYERGE